MQGYHTFSGIARLFRDILPPGARKTHQNFRRSEFSPAKRPGFGPRPACDAPAGARRPRLPEPRPYSRRTPNAGSISTRPPQTSSPTNQNALHDRRPPILCPPAKKYPRPSPNRGFQRKGRDPSFGRFKGVWGEIRNPPEPFLGSARGYSFDSKRRPSGGRGKHGFSGLKRPPASFSSRPSVSPAASSASLAAVSAPEKLRRTFRRAMMGAGKEEDDGGLTPT